MNRATYSAWLAILIAAYIILTATIERPPGAEVAVAFLTVPRLHDIGRSGWWLLTLLAGEFLAVAIGWQGGEHGILLAGGLFAFFALMVLVVIALIPGEPEANKWGEPPSPGFEFFSAKRRATNSD
jgi:uncharacterized membrane protein YhaH (DUF805 family)